jgi:trk system potassium uptake protein TrkH
MNWHTVFHYLGWVMLSFAFFSLTPLIFTLAFDDGVYIPFVLTSFISCILGFFLIKKFKRGNLTTGSVMVLASLSFLIVSLIGSVAYLDHLSPIDAFFESVSGFTTTGLTTIKPESLPPSILFFRSLTQWLGGLGILLVIILLLPSPGMSSYYVYKNEIKTDRPEKEISLFIKKILIFYVGFTLIGFFLFAFVGMPIFDALNHGMTAISTGGFSVKNESLGYYANPWIEIIAVFLMVMGATSFFMHLKIFNKQFSEYAKSSETQLFWFLIIVFSLLLSLAVSAEPLRNGIFYTFASLTTGGFNLGYTQFPDLAKSLIIILMIIGGFAGSLAGGLKLIRVGVIGKAMTWISKKIFYPNSAVIPLKYNKRAIGDEELTMISLFSFAYILILVISSLILSFMGYATIDAFFVSASAEGTVGLTTIDIASMNFIGKIILICDMFLGRLEIIPFFVLFFSIYRRIKFG